MNPTGCPKSPFSVAISPHNDRKWDMGATTRRKACPNICCSAGPHRQKVGHGCRPPEGMSQYLLFCRPTPTESGTWLGRSASPQAGRGQDRWRRSRMRMFSTIGEPSKP